jgi:hypothetical protein
LPDQPQRAIRHRTRQALRERTVVGEASKLRASMAVGIASILDEVTRAKTLGPAVTRQQPGLKHVASPGPALGVNSFIEVEQRSERDFTPPAWGQHKRDIATVDPALKTGVADTEELGGQGTRDGVAELLLERRANSNDVAIVSGTALGAAKARNMVEQPLLTGVCHGFSVLQSYSFSTVCCNFDHRAGRSRLPFPS